MIKLITATLFGVLTIAYFNVVSLNKRDPSSIENNNCINSLKTHIDSIDQRAGSSQKKLHFHYNFSHKESYFIENQKGARKVEIENYVASRKGDNIEWWHYTEVIKQSKNSNLENKSNQQSRFNKVVDEAMDLVVKSYQTRRDWSEEFIEKIRAGAHTYAHRSTYINVRNEIDDAPGEIIGTLKIVGITKDESLTPMEEILSLNLPKNQGYKFELSNFAISRDYNRPVFSELATHLINFTKRLDNNVKLDQESPLYYTYADRPSMMMYKQLGFKPIEGIEKIKKNGTTWTAIALTPKDLYGLVERVLRTRSVFSEIEVEHLKQLRKSLEQIEENNLELNTYVTTDLKLVSSVYNFKELRVGLSEEIKTKKDTKVRELTFLAKDFYEGIMIPSDYYPIPIDKEILTYDGANITFDGEVLHIKKNDISIKIKVNQSLDEFDNIDYKSSTLDFIANF